MTCLKRLSLFLLVLITAAAQLACTSEPPVVTDLTQQSLLPKPVSVTSTSGTFALTDQTGIYIQSNSDELQRIGTYLSDHLSPATGYALSVNTTDDTPDEGNIFLKLDETDTELGEEGYELIVTEDLVTLTAHQPAGLFRGVQTIRQMLPAAIEKDSPQNGPWQIATGTVRDYPSYAYRGAMLDVARHFFQVEDVKRYIDLIAYYKMNALHLHLSDDQGWRIEIKSWPKLAEYGGSTQVGGSAGGHYTQEQYADLVQYAQDRYITIVPEIDMPGHTNAALTSYAELNCNGKASELYTGTEVGFSTLCTDKEITYQFVDDVISELAALTPGPYIHIGGDESHVTAMEDYIPFVNRAQAIAEKYGKQVIGWDEIANAELIDSAIVQYWAEAENVKKAMEQDARVIMSPAVKAYLDMQYDSTTELGLHWAAYIEVDSAYDWDPASMVPGLGKDQILGIEAPLWTETITNMDEIEYMVFPRLIGLAEVGWTPAADRQWDEYRIRLGKHAPYLEALEIDYYPSKLVNWERGDNSANQTM
uniref:beta-N-acetylhexosaminidase n=1 Tax=Roseihalotalea indica TaxID=2867963 RepID=A0AA49GUN9_9BACT|nr:beta-N-acetylhexosaminidase [Tunicatimonas sp. TK19036]